MIVKDFHKIKTFNFQGIILRYPKDINNPNDLIDLDERRFLRSYGIEIYINGINNELKIVLNNTVPSYKRVREFQSLMHTPEVNKEDQTALMQLVNARDLEKVFKLLYSGSSPVAINYKQVQDGLTCLHYAINNDDSDMLGLLFSFGANPNIKTNNSLTIMDYALQQNATKCQSLIRDLKISQDDTESQLTPSVRVKAAIT